MKNKNIKVKCIEGYKLYKNDKEKTLIAVVEEGKVYDAILYEETDEYFAKDKEGREFYVGEIDINENFIIVSEFTLIYPMLLERKKILKLNEYRK